MIVQYKMMDCVKSFIRRLIRFSQIHLPFIIVNERIFALDRLICVGNKKKKKMTFNAHTLFFDRYSLAFFFII